MYLSSLFTHGMFAIKLDNTCKVDSTVKNVFFCHRMDWYAMKELRPVVFAGQGFLTCVEGVINTADGNKGSAKENYPERHSKSC